MGRIIIDENKPLSKSALWDYQKNYFDSKGIRAWDRSVPYFATSNLVIARAYAQVILRFVQEGIRSGYIKTGEPIYIIEVGAGTGKLAFHVLSVLVPLFEHFKLDIGQLCYVLTDFTESNLSFWERQTQLKPFVDLGLLDYAIYDVMRSETVSLEKRRISITRGSCSNPLIAITNYVFDAIPGDVFRVSEGRFQEGLVELFVESDNAELSEEIKADYQFQDTSVNYYDDDNLNKILEYFSTRYKDSTILIPTGAIQCINYLRSLSADRLLLISADKGYSDEDDMEGLKPPSIAFHRDKLARFFMVNYPAISHYIKSLGGDICQPVSEHGLQIFLYSLGKSFVDMPETRHAYQQKISDFSIEEFLCLKNAVINNADTLSLNDLLAALRLSYWDPIVMTGFVDALIDKLTEARPAAYIRELKHGLEQMEKNYYHLPANNNILFSMGRISCSLGSYKQAIDYYQQSIELLGVDWSVMYNISICYYYAKEYSAAQKACQKTLELNPESELAYNLLSQINELLPAPDISPKLSA